MPAEDLARPGVAGSPGQPMLRRIGSLLAPYRWWLALVLVTVLVSASLGAIAPFLTRAVFDDALFPVGADGAIGSPDLERLYWLVAGLIAIPLVSALIGVGQTYLTNRIGNSAMADLRVALFEHPEKMELAFFTSTKTGDIQTSSSGPAPSRPGSTTRWSSPTAACWRTGRTAEGRCEPLTQPSSEP